MPKTRSAICGSRTAARARMFLSTPDQGKGPVATETALECKLDPQHGLRLQEPGIAQRPGVDNFKAERSDKFDDLRLFCHIVASHEHY